MDYIDSLAYELERAERTSDPGDFYDRAAELETNLDLAGLGEDLKPGESIIKRLLEN